MQLPKKMRRIFLSFVILFVIIISLFIIVKFCFIKNTENYLKNTNEALSGASEQLHVVGRAIESGEKSNITGLLNGYKTNISLALKNAKKIVDPHESKEALTLIFRSIAPQLTTLRTIQIRSSAVDSGMVDGIRDTNIQIQEQAVSQLSALSRENLQNNQSEGKSNTTSMLSCPGCNVIILSLTTLRKDHMGIYGYDKKTTPNIDRFFDNALLFNDTIAPTSWTTPNAVSLFTSLFPYRHGIMDRMSFPLYNREVLTLAEILKQDDYQAAAFTGGGDYNNRYGGLRRGFDYYLDEDNYAALGVKGDISLGGGGSLMYAPLRSFLSFGTNWMESHSQNKFFLLLQGYDTHCPLDPREPFAAQFTKGLGSSLDFSYCHWTHEDTAPLYEDGKKYWVVTVPSKKKGGAPTEAKFFQSDVDYMNALYDARIAEMDFYLNDFFEKIKSLGLEKNTVVILMSDHGEMLGEHGRFMRGGTTTGTSYEEALSFPLLIKHPKVIDPIVIDDVVQTVDIMPTILSMLDLSDPQQDIREGNALNFSVFGDSPTNKYGFAASTYTPFTNNLFFEHATASESIRDTTWKLIKETVFSESGINPASFSYKLFNLENDPKEETNLYESEIGQADTLKKELETWLDRYR